MLRIYEADHYQALSRKAAAILSAQILIKPDCVLGLATGETPQGIYGYLTRWYDEENLDFSQVRTVNLDEYMGLAPDHPCSYHRYMAENLFNHVNIAPENTHIPAAVAVDTRAQCAAYDALISGLGGTDLQVLGIGENGHIGFNEPGEAFIKETHVVHLSESTIRANARFFESHTEVPRCAVTMGIKSILQSKHILLVVSGEKKARALYDAFFGPITPQLPASILQLHPHVSMVADKAALSLF